MKLSNAGDGSSLKNRLVLFYDCMIDDATLFQRSDNVELGWSIATPILEAWSTLSAQEFLNYTAGSWSPKAVDDLLWCGGQQWRSSDY